jgi:acetylornithine/succinyldiaminopimelate/putrescine aminotransferase
MTIAQRRSNLMPNLFGETMPTISHGKGVWLYDTNGKKYLDGCSGATAANIGHAVPEVNEAIHRQAQKVSFVYRGHFTNDAAESLASEIAARAPNSLSRLFLVSSGSEAVETAASWLCNIGSKWVNPKKTWCSRGARVTTAAPSRHSRSLVIHCAVALGSTCSRIHHASPRRVATVANSARPSQNATCTAPTMSNAPSSRRTEPVPPSS